MKKLWWKSKTLQGLFVIVISFVIRYAAAKGWLSGLLLETTLTYLKELCDALGLGGIAYAFYGRVKTEGEKLSLK